MLEDDFVWGEATELAELPPILVERLQHYFTTYKLVPGTQPQIAGAEVYGADHAARWWRQRFRTTGRSSRLGRSARRAIAIRMPAIRQASPAGTSPIVDSAMPPL